MKQNNKSVDLLHDPAALINKEGKVVHCNALFQKIVLGKEGRSASLFNIDSLGTNVHNAVIEAMNGHFVESFTYIEEKDDITDWRVACIPEINDFVLIILTSRSADIAFYDALTKLPNRHVALDRLDREWERWTRAQKVPFGIALADIDFFKNVNDSYGHDIGDQVLQFVSKSFTQSLRSGDWISRWGGEEFLLLFHDVNSDGSTQAAERCRVAVAKEPFITSSGLKIPVTVSIGVVNTGLYKQIQDTQISLDKIIEEADILLYDAKREGRNKIVSLKDHDYLRWSESDIKNEFSDSKIEIITKEISANENIVGGLFKPAFKDMNRSTPRHFFQSAIRENLSDEAESYWLDKIYQEVSNNKNYDFVLATCNSIIFKDIEEFPKYCAVVKKFVDNNINLVLTSKYHHAVEDFNHRIMDTISKLKVQFCPWVTNESTAFASLILSNKQIPLVLVSNAGHISSDQDLEHLQSFLNVFQSISVPIIVSAKLKDTKLAYQNIMYIDI